MVKSIVKETKSKNFTFRITNALADDLAEVKLKCEQHGLRINVTEALTAALEREIKALQKHVQGIEPNWTPGQMEIPEIENLKNKEKGKK